MAKDTKSRTSGKPLTARAMRAEAIARINEKLRKAGAAPTFTVGTAEDSTSSFESEHDARRIYECLIAALADALAFVRGANPEFGPHGRSLVRFFEALGRDGHDYIASHTSRAHRESEGSEDADQWTPRQRLIYRWGERVPWDVKRKASTPSNGDLALLSLATIDDHPTAGTFKDTLEREREAIKKERKRQRWRSRG